jgi:hypothetical protein
VDPSTDLVVDTIQTAGVVGVGLAPNPNWGIVVSADTGLTGSAYFGDAVHGATTIRAIEGYLEGGRSVPMGYWQNEPFNAANFTSSHGTWVLTAPDQVILRYTLIGKTMMVAFSIDNSTVVGVTTYLRIKVPGGYTASSLSTGRGATDYVDNGAPISVTGFAVVIPSSTQIQLYKDEFVNWQTSLNNTDVRGSIAFEIA